MQVHVVVFSSQLTFSSLHPQESFRSRFIREKSYSEVVSVECSRLSLSSFHLPKWTNKAVTEQSLRRSGGLGILKAVWSFFFDRR